MEEMIDVRLDKVADPKIDLLLEEHHEDMGSSSPPESVHALNVEELRGEDVTVWTAWRGEQLAGIGALQQLDSSHGEIKSMRTAKQHLRKGVAKKILETILAAAIARQYERLSLETGSMEVFAPARKLYEKFGFEYCDPFSNYKIDPYSSYMTKTL
jgi:putative acetyltransferase